MTNINNQISSENTLKVDTTTLLSVTRTRLSSERTLMSWIRTSFSMITFGFGILKFFQMMAAQNTAAHLRTTSSTQLGVLLIVLGIFSLFPGMIDHRRTLNEMSQYDGKSRWSYAFVLAICVGLIGVYVLSRAVAVRIF